MKPLRVLVLLHPDLVPPDSLKGRSEQEINDDNRVNIDEVSRPHPGHGASTGGNEPSPPKGYNLEDVVSTQDPYRLNGNARGKLLDVCDNRSMPW